MFWATTEITTSPRSKRFRVCQCCLHYLISTERQVFTINVYICYPLFFLEGWTAKCLFIPACVFFQDRKSWGVLGSWMLLQYNLMLKDCAVTLKKNVPSLILLNIKVVSIPVSTGLNIFEYYVSTCFIITTIVNYSYLVICSLNTVLPVDWLKFVLFGGHCFKMMDQILWSFNMFNWEQYLRK